MEQLSNILAFVLKVLAAVIAASPVIIGIAACLWALFGNDDIDDKSE